MYVLVLVVRYCTVPEGAKNHSVMNDTVCREYVHVQLQVQIFSIVLPYVRYTSTRTVEVLYYRNSNKQQLKQERMHFQRYADVLFFAFVAFG